jgi:hypothetical protein
MAEIIVPGKIKDRFCGGLIEIEWPSTVKKQKLNKMMKGLYLVKSITHQYAVGQSPYYTQKLVLMKNGYTDADAANVVKLVKATKSNTYGDRASIYKLTAVK